MYALARWGLDAQRSVVPPGVAAALLRTEGRSAGRVREDAERPAAEAGEGRRALSRGEADLTADGGIPADLAGRAPHSGHRGDRGRRSRAQTAEGRALRRGCVTEYRLPQHSRHVGDACAARSITTRRTTRPAPCSPVMTAASTMAI